MKNDIIGSLGVMLLAAVLLLAVGGSSEQFLWNGFGRLNFHEQEEEAEVVIAPEKNETLFPKLTDNVQQKWGKKWTIEQDRVEGIYWLDGTYIRAHGLMIEQPYQVAATELNEYLNWQEEQLSEFGFKEQKIRDGECLIVEKGVFSECAGAYVRNEEKCLVLVAYPVTDNDQSPKNIEIKLLCNFV
ncbi:hypothetical protein FWH30_00095 [Microgenomates group bacterium]|nr:hypothetical protein [Microgenomates group bacterium]